MTKTTGIFPSFFQSGFECSTFLWRGKKRKNLIVEGQHDIQADNDYKILRALGIGVSREAIPWPFVDKECKYNFSSIDPMIDAMNKYQIAPIWDLCHYGYPDDLDPFSETFVQRFKDYCKASASYVMSKMNGPYFFSPINEITYFSFIGGEWGWAAPYKTSKQDRFALRKNLCKAAISGSKIIKEMNPAARIIHIDPLVQVVAPHDRPDLIAAAHNETYIDTYAAWDILYGNIYPELGGSPDILDIVGVNNYAVGFMEYRESGPHIAVKENDDRVISLCSLLLNTWNRYKKPIVISETSSTEERRPIWLKDIMEESLAAVKLGVDIQGMCLFPAVNSNSWETGEWISNGLCDVKKVGSIWERHINQPYIAELLRWQKELNRVTMLDENPFEEPVNLQDLLDAANRLNTKPDRDWHFQ